MAANGYTVAVLAFANVTGTTVALTDNATIGSRPTDLFQYNYKAEGQALVILSLGGYDPAPFENAALDKPTELAKSLIDYCSSHYLHGIDFDLEDKVTGLYPNGNTHSTKDKEGNETHSLGIGETLERAPKYKKITDLLVELRKQAEARQHEFPRGFYITAAPQTSHDRWGAAEQGDEVPEKRLFWAAAGATHAYFDSLLKEDACDGDVCFDALFLQNYNAQRMHPEAAFKLTKDALGGNKKTIILMGYDLEAAEWGNNFPVVHGTTEYILRTSDYPLRWDEDIPGKLKEWGLDIQLSSLSNLTDNIQSAEMFAQSELDHEQLGGAFVWNADVDAVGGATNDKWDKKYSWAKAMAKIYAKELIRKGCSKVEATSLLWCKDSKDNFCERSKVLGVKDGDDGVCPGCEDPSHYKSQDACESREDAFRCKWRKKGLVSDKRAKGYCAWKDDAHLGNGQCNKDNPCDHDNKDGEVCCSRWGWCGATPEHCDCPECVNSGHACTMLDADSPLWCNDSQQKQTLCPRSEFDADTGRCSGD